MKKIILVLAFSAFGYLSLQAQEFQGMAVYESKQAADFKSISQETGK
jgi:hypothetical protein